MEKESFFRQIIKQEECKEHQQTLLTQSSLATGPILAAECAECRDGAGRDTRIPGSRHREGLQMCLSVFKSWAPGTGGPLAWELGAFQNDDRKLLFPIKLPILHWICFSLTYHYKIIVRNALNFNFRDSHNSIPPKHLSPHGRHLYICDNKKIVALQTYSRALIMK